MLFNKRKGVVIQITEYPRKKGGKSKSFTVNGENVDLVYARIHDLYENLTDNNEIIIKHIK